MAHAHGDIAAKRREVILGIVMSTPGLTYDSLQKTYYRSPHRVDGMHWIENDVRRLETEGKIRRHKTASPIRWMPVRKI